MTNILLVGAGGAIGAIGRYLVGLLPIKSTFPFLTFFINITGAIIIGIVLGIIISSGQPRENIRLFWCVGVCGGFTTFSAFSAESLKLFEGGHSVMGALYIILSVGLCLFGVWLGRTISLAVLGN